jgi:hypothetical protein
MRGGSARPTENQPPAEGMRMKSGLLAARGWPVEPTPGASRNCQDQALGIYVSIIARIAI